MPPVTNENDLKRRARRRLIGAVALALAAVIVVPLLLEDEPPPAGPLDVRMAPSSEATMDDPIVAIVPPQPVGQPLDQDDAAAAAPTVPVPQLPTPPASKPQAAPKPTPPKPAPAKPAAVKPSQTATSRPATAAFVVQLAALKDAKRAGELKKRAARSGLPVYTDRAGELTRVRVGPFASREEAVSAAVKLAETGLPGQILSQ